MPLLYRFMIIFAFDRVLASGTKQHCFSDHEDDGRVVARDVRMVEGKERIIERVIERDGRDGKWDATELCDQEKRQRWIIVRTVSCDQFSRMFRASGTRAEPSSTVFDLCRSKCPKNKLART